MKVKLMKLSQQTVKNLQISRNLRSRRSIIPKTSYREVENDEIGEELEDFKPTKTDLILRVGKERRRSPRFTEDKRVESEENGSDEDDIDADWNPYIDKLSRINLHLKVKVNKFQPRRSSFNSLSEIEKLIESNSKTDVELS